MARTRALRTAAKRALGIASKTVRSEDDPSIEAEVIEETSPQEDVVAVEESSPPSAPAAAAENVKYVGFLAVPYRGDGPWQAQEPGEIRTKEQCEQVEALLPKLNLEPSALAAVCKAMFRVHLSQASKVALDELKKWVESQIAKGEPPAAGEEEPPF